MKLLETHIKKSYWVYIIRLGKISSDNNKKGVHIKTWQYRYLRSVKVKISKSLCCEILRYVDVAAILNL